MRASNHKAIKNLRKADRDDDDGNDGDHNTDEQHQDGDDHSDEDSLSFASEEDAATLSGSDNNNDGRHAKKKTLAVPSPRPKKQQITPRRQLSPNYRAGERFQQEQENAETAQVMQSGMTKREQLLAKNAERLKQQRLTEEKAQRAKLQEEQLQKRIDTLSKLSPLNVLRNKTTTSAATQDGDEDTDEVKETHRKQHRRRYGDDDEDDDEQDDNDEDGHGNDDDSSDHEEAPEITPAEQRENEEVAALPNRSTLYQPVSFSLADPQVTALAARFSSLSGTLDTRNRRYIYEGPMQRQGRYSVVQRHAFLFSDKFILTKVKSNGKLQMKQNIDLYDVTLDIRPYEQQANELHQTKLPHPFRIIFPASSSTSSSTTSPSTSPIPRSSSSVKQFIVSVPDEEQRRAWIRHMQLAISRIMWQRNNEMGISLEFGWYTRIVIGSIQLAVLEGKEEQAKQMLEYDEKERIKKGPLAAISTTNNTITSTTNTKPATSNSHINNNASASSMNRSHVLEPLIHQRDQEGWTLLHIAVHTNNPAMITLLLQHGADITMKDSERRTAIHIAAKLGYADSIAALLSEAHIHPSLYHPLPSMIHTDRSSFRLRLTTSSAIWQCALSHMNEYEKCIRLLVLYAKDYDYSVATSTTPAINIKRAITGDVILDVRDNEGRNLLEVATLLSLTDIIPIIVNLGATVDTVNPTTHTTPLCVSAQRGDMDTMTTLIQLGAQVNWRDPDTYNAVIHYAMSLDIATFLVANGARLSMKNKEGVRITDIYSQTNETARLYKAEELFNTRRPVDTNEPIQPRPTTESMNGGHSLDTCYVCNDTLSGLGGIGKKKEWCRRCGHLMCSPCVQQQCIFISNISRNATEEETAHVCCGCYNRLMYLPETQDKKKQRLARQKKAAKEAAQSLFNLEYLAQALTAVYITTTPYKGDMQLVSSYHGPVMIEERDVIEDPVAAVAKGTNPLSSSTTSINGTTSSTPSNVPTVRKTPSAAVNSAAANKRPSHLRIPSSTNLIGPAINANLAGREDKIVNYAGGGTIQKKNSARNLQTSSGASPRHVIANMSQMALNNAPVIDNKSIPTGAPHSARGTGNSPDASPGLRGSRSADGLTELKGKKTTTAATNITARSKTNQSDIMADNESDPSPRNTAVNDAENNNDDDDALLVDDDEPDQPPQPAVKSKKNVQAAASNKTAARKKGKIQEDDD